MRLFYKIIQKRVFLPLATRIPLFNDAGCSPFAVVTQQQYKTALPGSQRGCSTAELVAEPIWDGGHFSAFGGCTWWPQCAQPRPITTLTTQMSQCGSNNDLALQHGGFCTMWSFVEKGRLWHRISFSFHGKYHEINIRHRNGVRWQKWACFKRSD